MAASGGCGARTQDTTELGGESHFLLSCTHDCDGELSCIEGTCTRRCTASVDSCASLAVGAECRVGGGESSGRCDLACVEDEDCAGLGSEASPLRCAAGFCRDDEAPSSDVVASGLVPNDGRCESDEDCPRGPGGPTRCIALVSGYRACLDQTPPTTEPSPSPTVDECDGGRPCPEGSACYYGVGYPSGYCGLGGASPRNACRADECQADADCESGYYCGPPGLETDAFAAGGAVRHCVEAGCRAHADCDARSGGVCALVDGHCEQSPDVSLANSYRPPRLACTYPDGCVRDADCPVGSACRVVNDASVCVRVP